MKKLLAMVVSLLVIGLIGCQQAPEDTPVPVEEEEVEVPAPEMPNVPASGSDVAPSAESDEMVEDLIQLDDLEENLDLTDLDDIDAELEDFDW